MLPDSENPFAPPQETGTVLPLDDGLTWSLGVRELIVALVVLVIFCGGVAATHALIESSVIPIENGLLAAELEEDAGGLMVASLVTAILMLAIVLWNHGVLFSVGGLIALLLGTVIWGAAAAVLFTPFGAVVVWVTVLLAVILGVVLLRK